MTIKDLAPDQVDKQTAEKLRAMIRATEGFPVPELLDIMLKADIVALCINFLKEKAPDQLGDATPPPPALPPEDMDYSAQETLERLKEMGFRDKEEAMSHLKGILREKAMLGHRVTELNERELALDRREVDIKGIEKFIDKKKVELEAMIVEKKKLVGLIEQAKNQGITV